LTQILGQPCELQVTGELVVARGEQRRQGRQVVEGRDQDLRPARNLKSQGWSRIFKLAQKFD
jgi:hypothetical protein